VALWVSEKTKLKVWLTPAAPLGVTESAVGTGAVTISVTGRLEPLKLAVITAVWLPTIVPLVTAKFALLWPAETVRLPATPRAALLLLSVTTAGLAVVLFKETEHVVDELVVNEADKQVKELNRTGPTRLSVTVFAEAPEPAVMMAVWSALTDAAVALKLAVVCPAVTVTLGGTVRLTLLLESTTRNPPACAAAVRETVHDVLAGVIRTLVVQVTPAITADCDTEIAPATPLAGIELPVGLAATTPLIWIGILDVTDPAATWKVAVASKPSAIVF